MVILAAIGAMYSLAAISGLLCLYVWAMTPMELEHGLDGEGPDR